MKLYSDTLTLSDLRAATPRGCNLEAVTIGRPRNRKHGWIVRLSNVTGARWKNTGHYGAGSEKAATWDEHGEWMSALYAKDATMIVAHYKSRDDFHRATEGKYDHALASK